MSIEVMKQALEALEKSQSALAEELSAWDIDPPLHHVQESHDLCGPAITSLRQAIAEAEKQDKFCDDNCVWTDHHKDCVRASVACQHKRYSIDVTEQIGTCYDCGSEGRMRFVVDDTHPQPKAEKQKPVAWKHYTKPLERRLQHLETKEHQNSFDKHEASALRHVLGIVTQPKREWVGLTDDEKKLINIGARYHWEMTTQEYANLIQAMTEAKLKEKNT